MNDEEQVLVEQMRELLTLAAQVGGVVGKGIVKGLSGLMLECDVAAMTGGTLAKSGQTGYDVVNVTDEQIQVKHRAPTRIGKRTLGTFVDLRSVDHGRFKRLVIGHYANGDYTIPVITHDVAHDDVWANVKRYSNGRIQYQV